MSEGNSDLKEIINRVVQIRIDANRRYIDEILEKIQDQNHQYYLQRLGYELRELELAQKERNPQLILHHKVMADTYLSIIQNCFSR